MIMYDNLNGGRSAVDEVTIRKATGKAETITMVKDDNIVMIKDSGNRTEFPSGAVRDIQKGKGRCDLLPLSIIAGYFDHIQLPVEAKILGAMNWYHTNHNPTHAYDALEAFCDDNWEGEPESMILAVAKHFEAGAEKYGDSNWKKGIPCERYFDSAIRHYLKYERGDDDEPHDRAFVWNVLCCLWTQNEYGWNLENLQNKKTEGGDAK